MLDLEVAGREQRRIAAVSRHRGQMRPPVALPWEDEPSGPGPHHLVIANDRMEHAALPGLRPPYLATGAGCGIGDAYRPWLIRRAPGTEVEHAAARNADECNLLRIRRPHGRHV